MAGISLKSWTILVAIASLTAACTGAGAATPTSSGPSVGATRLATTPTAPIRLTLPTMTTTAEVTREVKPTPSPPRARPTATATLEGQMEITIGDYYFRPQVVTVTVGTRVIWKPVGVLFHTIVSKDSPPLFEGATGGVGTHAFRFTFRKPGVYAYHCDYHPGAMDAWIMVVEGD